MFWQREAETVVTYEVGSIALTEHTWMPVIICDRTDLGTRLTMLDAGVVPETFLLMLPDAARAQRCRIIWRTAEVIGAWFDGDIE